MDYGDILQGLVQKISNQSAEVEEKIQWLESAKREVESEKKTSMEEIKTVKQPELGSNWTGERAEKFEEQRQNAYEEIRRIVTNEYEDYISDIQSKINELDLQRVGLNIAGGIANEAGELIEKGEDAVELVSSKINQIKESLL